MGVVDDGLEVVEGVLRGVRRLSPCYRCYLGGDTLLDGVSPDGAARCGRVRDLDQAGLAPR